MSMDVTILGIVPADDDYNKKSAAYWACKDAGIPIPDDLKSFFDGQDPCKEGMEIDLDYDTDYGDCIEYYTVDIKDLPKNIKQIQFILSC